jgi:hypothetical protein
MGLSADSATRDSDLGIFEDPWGDGADSTQKVDTLAGRRVSSTPGKRLAEAWRASHSASLGEVMTHPYLYNCKFCRFWPFWGLFRQFPPQQRPFSEFSVLLYNNKSYIGKESGTFWVILGE